MKKFQKLKSDKNFILNLENRLRTRLSQTQSVRIRGHEIIPRDIYLIAFDRKETNTPTSKINYEIWWNYLKR